MTEVNLSSYKNDWYHPGSPMKRVLWYVVNALIFNSYIFPYSGLKRLILRAFGARIGKGVVLKPRINIKYPWFLEIGSYTWIGEGVWIDNLAKVKIGDNCCVSQGALLLTGNHNYKISSFDLLTKEILLENGVWVGAKSVVTPGVVLRSHAVLSVGSIGVGELEGNTIYQGNPAKPVRKRDLSA